ncbi:Major Facilitator Superfamily (MFS) protein [Tubulinosema ratisbonensis]|uniref:Major Facilitator Superfamily (MFS) protein n=1 Tax=Tubulinosema ratisbonensis TaxID=291195 RepID=A0A437ALI2_9MICR|nr:Major Facilitator Superfamily (MFS) protein [Tubulinosema ratisbonensis]
MRKILKWVWCTDFFTYSCLFSIQSYIKPLLISNSEIKCKETSLLDMFTILRMVTAYLFTYLGDKLHSRYFIAIFCLLGYALVVTSITFLLPFLGAQEFGFKMILVNFFYEAFESGLLPLLETMSVTVSTKYGGKYAYATMRSALVLGRISGHLLPVFYNKVIFNNDKSNRNHFFAMVTWASFAFPLLITMHRKCKFIELPAQTELSMKCGRATDAKIVQENVLRNLYEILHSEYFFILLSILLFGVYKTAIVNYQSLFTNTIFNDTKFTAMIYIFRSLPELFTTMIAPFFEGIIGNLWIIFIGGVCGLIKTFVYAYYPMNWSVSAKVFLFLALEIPKAIFCDWVCYGATKMTEFYNPMYRRATAQGLFNGFFNGGCAFISGIVGYFTLGDQITLQNIQNLKNFFFICGCFGIAGLVILVGLYIYQNRK